MKSPFKIGIAGTHSTGKSTFLRVLRAQLETRGIRTGRIGDFATEARRLGFPILREHTFQSTCWIIVQGISKELEAALTEDVLLVDRPVVDALGYLNAALQWREASLDPLHEEYLTKLVQLHLPTYDVLIKTRVDRSMPVDTAKERDTDPMYRLHVAEALDGVFEKLNVNARELRVDNVEELAGELADLVELARGPAREELL